MNCIYKRALAMRILHLTDLHFNIEQCEWIKNNQHLSDVICITGDLLDTSLHQPVSIDKQIE